MSKEYPKIMRHPQESAAELATDGKPAVPARNAPVMVNSSEQEEEYAAKGYKAKGKSDPQAFAAAVAIPGGTPQVKAAEYPKWVGSAESGKVVRSEAEELAYLESLEPPKSGLKLSAPGEAA